MAALLLADAVISSPLRHKSPPPAVLLSFQTVALLKGMKASGVPRTLVTFNTALLACAKVCRAILSSAFFKPLVCVFFVALVFIMKG